MKHLRGKQSLQILGMMGLFLGLASCGGGQSGTDGSKSSIGAIVIDGPINDGSFNEGAWAGMLQAQKELGCEVVYRENKQASEYPAAFSAVTELHPDLILGVGFKLEEETRRQAQENPTLSYVSIDGTMPEAVPSNMIVVGFSVEQASFLAGYVAARMTQTGKVGFLGGIEGEIIGLFDYGYEAGALYARPDIQILNQYAQSFNNVAKGRSIGELMIQNGVDVIFHAAGPTGKGMIEAVREKQMDNERTGNPNRLWAIGVDIDEYPDAPEVMLTSAVKRVDSAVYQLMEQVKKGTFQGGQTMTFGLEGDYVGLAQTSSIHIPSQILQEVDHLKSQIARGTIVVPRTAEDLKVYKGSLMAS